MPQQHPTVLLTIALAAAAVHAGPPLFSATLISQNPDPNGPSFGIQGVTADGTVLGSGNKLWNDGVVSQFAPESAFTAIAISESGVVVGATTAPRQAAFWSNGAITTLEVGPELSIAGGVSHDGSSIAGSWNDTPTVWRDGERFAASLDDAYVRGIFTDVGNDGTAVGRAMYPSPDIANLQQSHGIIQRDGRTSFIRSVPGASDIEHRAIEFSATNSTGHAVGAASDLTLPVAGLGTAFEYRDGAVEALPKIEGASHTATRDINDAGWIVGTSYIQHSDTYFATLWLGSIAYNLNDYLAVDLAGMQVSAAHAVSDSGDILVTVRPIGASGSLGGTSYLLSPIPTPSSASLMAIAAAATRRRR